MTKYSIFCFLIVAICLPFSSIDAHSLHKGNILLGGDISYSFANGEANVGSSYNGIENPGATIINVNPSVGYFTSDGLMPGFGILYSYESQSDISSHKLGPKLFITYYIGNKSMDQNRVFGFVGISGYYLRQIYRVEFYDPSVTPELESFYSNTGGAGLYGGIEYFVVSNISIYGKANFIMDLNKPDAIWGNRMNLQTGKQFIISFGINGYINRTAK
jgi:hypothetical protein